MTNHEKWPAEQTPELTTMLNGLKAEHPDPELLARLGERQRNVLGAYVKADALADLGAALRALCQQKDPRAPALKSVVEATPMTLRVLLGVSPLHKYGKQRARAWKEDITLSTAIYEVALSDRLHKLAAELTEAAGTPVEEEASPDDDAEIVDEEDVDAIGALANIEA